MGTTVTHNQDLVVRLALAEISAEHNEAIIAALRNGGIATRPFQAMFFRELEQAVHANTIDVIVLGEGQGQWPEGEALILAQKYEIPIIIIADGLDAPRYEHWKMGGFADVLIRGRSALIAQVIRRQMDALLSKRLALEAQAARASADERSQLLMNTTTEAIAYLHEGLHVQANPAYLGMLGQSSFEDIEGWSLLDVIDVAASPSVRDVLKKMNRGEIESSEIEVSLRVAAGGRVISILSLAPAHYDGESCVQVIARPKVQPTTQQAPISETPVGSSIPAAPVQVSAHLAAPAVEVFLEEEESNELGGGDRDAATGLYSQQYFTELLRGMSQENASGSVWLVRADRHASIVGEIGASRSNDLLSALSQQIEAALAESVVARWGENTLAVVCPGCDHQDSQAFGERIRKTVSSSILEIGHHSLTSTVSLGGVQMGSREMSADRTLKVLEEKLALALQKGGNRCEFFDPDAAEKAAAQNRYRDQQGLAEAMANDKYRIYYQPWVPVTGIPWETYEVDLRVIIDQEERQRSSLEEVVSDLGLGAALDMHAFQAGLHTVFRRHGEGKKTRAIVRLTTAALDDESFAASAMTALTKTPVSAGHLVVELSVATVSTRVKSAQALRKALADLGVPMYVGEASADPSVLKTLDLIGVDGLCSQELLANDLARDSENQKSIKMLADWAKLHKKPLFVAGVDSASTLTFLFSSGVDSVQGGFLADPSLTMGFDFSQFGA